MRAGVFDAHAFAERRWRPATVVRRAYEVLRKEGFRTLWFRVLGETVYRRLIVMERPFGAPVVRATKTGAEIRLLRPDELTVYLVLRPDAQAAEIASRFERGHACFAVWRDGSLIGACWAGRGRTWIDYLDVWVELCPGVGYLYDLYLVPAARGLSVHNHLFETMTDHYADEPDARVILATSNPETRTHRLFARLGCRYVTKLGTIRLGRWRFAFCRFPGRTPEERLLTVRHLQRVRSA